VPEEVLTDTVIEEIKTRCCFVGDGLDSDARHVPTPRDELMETDIAPSDASQSESEFSHLGSNASSQQESSEFSVVSHLHASKSDHRSENHLQALADMYTRQSTATDIQMRVVPPIAQQTGTGRGTLIVPGWIRERAAEVLFEGGDVDEGSVVEVILDSLLKVTLNLFISIPPLHMVRCL
jgi:actin-related protein 10